MEKFASGTCVYGKVSIRNMVIWKKNSIHNMKFYGKVRIHYVRFYGKLHTIFNCVKFLIFRTPENFAVIYLKFKQRPKLRVFYQNDANGLANSEDPDQTAPRSGTALFVQKKLRVITVLS